MNKRKIAMGPGASSLILIVVVLSLCMLAMLTLVSSKNDYSLSTRSASTVDQAYNLFDRSERSLAKLDGILAACAKDAAGQDEYLSAVEEQLPEEMTLDGDLVSWNETADTRTLACTVRLLPVGEGTRTEWVGHRLAVEEAEEEEFE